MSLTQALTGALTSLQANQRILSVISGNISNANTEGYTAQKASLSSIVAAGQVVGVDLADITRSVDQILVNQIQEQNSKTGKNDIIKDYMDRITFLFGQPNSNNDINAYLGDYFNSLSALAATPGDSTVRSLAVNSAVNLSGFLSDTANSLVDLQFAVEKEVDKAITDVNSLLARLKEVNSSISISASQGQNTNALLDRRDLLLSDLSNLIEVTVQEDSEGRVTIYTSNETNEFALLTSQGATLRLAYTRVTTEDILATKGDINPINVEFIDENDNVVLTQQLLPGGAVGTLEPNIGGKLGGLLQIRDTEIPDLMELLDNIASELIFQVNKLHNDGAGLPPADRLLGTNTVTNNEAFDSITGSTMFAILNSDGTPVTSPWSHLPANDDGTPLMPPLIIDYDLLEDGMTPQDIQKEFNEYYNEIENYVSLGPMGNIGLRGSTATGSGPITSATFNLEAMNISSGDATIVVNSATVSGGGGSESVGALPGRFTSGIDYAAGTRSFSDVLITVNFDGSSTHTISLDVTVTDADGNTHDSIITFSFNPNQANSNVKGERYPPVTADQDGTIIAPSPLTSIAAMRFFQADGTLANTGEEGTMRINAVADGTGIAIDEMDGEIGTTNARGISHYFGLNDFFVEPRPTDEDADPNQALNISVRADIVADPALMSRGQLKISRQPTDTTANPLVTYEIGSGDGSAVRNIVDMLLSPQDFGAAGGLPSITITLAEYSASITDLVALKTSNAANSSEQSTLILEGLTTRRDEFSGVNIDSELADTILFQNAYSAAARIIRTIDELFDELLRIGA